MKTIIRKAFWNYEKEEKWLNEMSAKGLMLTDCSWCRYVFADEQPSAYIYRIELLEYLPAHPISQQYLRFMEETGVEHIASYASWVYFRKKASDGAFDIYSDIDSRIKHYRRINLLWTVMACAEILVGISSICIGAILSFLSYNFTVSVICVCLGAIFLALGHPFRKKIGKLKKDKMIME